MNFWEVHGYIGGFFFVISLLLLPRLTILFSVSVWGVAAHVATVELGLGGFAGWFITLILSVIGWVGWIVFPRYVIAFAASIFFFSTNPVICVEAWLVAYVLTGMQREIFLQMRARARQKAEALRKERVKVQEEMRRAEEILRGMQNERANATSSASIDELMRRILEQQAFMRAQRERARQAASMRSKARMWWEVLDVSKNASIDTIKAAYRKIAKATHPDTAPDKKGDPAKFAEAAEAAKKALKEKNGA